MSLSTLGSVYALVALLNSQNPESAGIAPNAYLARHPLALAAPKPTMPRFGVLLPSRDCTAPAFGPRRPAFVYSPQAVVNERPHLFWLHDNTIIHCEIELSYRGQPFAAFVAERITRVFNYFDADRDGVLNRYEAEKIFSIPGVNDLLRGETYLPSEAEENICRKHDRDGDGCLSLSEFQAYYASVTPKLLKSQNIPSRPIFGSRANATMLHLLDTNHDGAISTQEFSDAPRLMAECDANEDGILRLEEILAKDPKLAIPKNPTTDNSASEEQPLAFVRRLYLSDSGKLATEELQEIMTTLDKNHDGTLTPSELSLSDAAWNLLDADKNQKLNPKEFESLVRLPVAVRIKLELSKVANGKNVTIEILDPKSLPGVVPQSLNAITKTLEVLGQTLMVSNDLLTNLQPQNRAINDLKPLFPKGKIEVGEADLTSPEFQYLRSVIDQADLNLDGRLSAVEYNAFLSAQSQITSLSVSLRTTSINVNLFELLDADNDTRLTFRELQSAAARLAPLCRSKTNGLTPDALPTLSVIELVQSNVAPAAVARRTATPKVVPQAMPVWFLKMDLNSDGDITRAEFLGNQSEFAAIDLDHDQLISREEALVADRKFRK